VFGRVPLQRFSAIGAEGRAIAGIGLAKAFASSGESSCDASHDVSSDDRA
jgi:hypothetical protein